MGHRSQPLTLLALPAALPTQLTPQAHCAMHLEERDWGACGSPLQLEKPQAPSLCSFYLIKTKKRQKQENKV